MPFILRIHMCYCCTQGQVNQNLWMWIWISLSLSLIQARKRLFCVCHRDLKICRSPHRQWVVVLSFVDTLDFGEVESLCSTKINLDYSSNWCHEFKDYVHTFPTQHWSTCPKTKQILYGAWTIWIFLGPDANTDISEVENLPYQYIFGGKKLVMILNGAFRPNEEFSHCVNRSSLAIWIALEHPPVLFRNMDVSKVDRLESFFGRVQIS